MKMYAIIVAAGAGSRMQSDTPKQFLLLHGKPVYFYPVQTFLDCFPDIEVILVIPSSYSNAAHDLLACFEKGSQVRVITGGSSRYESVKNGLVEIEDEGIVFIHDSVRPFIHKLFLRELLAVAIEKGNAIPCMPVTDSLRLVIGNDNHSISREQYRAIQTPQVFQSAIIKNAYRQSFKEIFTDDASVLEASGHKIHLVQGLRENIKITTPVDLKYAEMILNNQAIE